MMRILSAITLLLLAACTSQKAPSTPSTPPASAPTERAAQPAPANEAYLTSTASLKRAPQDAAKVPGTNAKQLVSNYLATLHRGEKLSILGTEGDYTRVKASDETVGWIKSSLLLPAAGVTEATLLDQADAFDRPDLLAVNAKRKIEPGTLILVVRARELFSEANVSGSTNVWLLTDRLSTTPKNVNAAKLVDKARWLIKLSKQEEAKNVLGLLRKEFADVPLVDVLARELGEIPDGGATDAGVVDGGTPPPATPAKPDPERTQDH